MGTPAQLAKDYAAAHGFTITSVGRRYQLTHSRGALVADVGGYAAALNAMMRFVAEQARKRVVESPSRGDWLVSLRCVAYCGIKRFNTRSEALKFVRQHFSDPRDKTVKYANISYVGA